LRGYVVDGKERRGEVGALFLIYFGSKASLGMLIIFELCFNQRGAGFDTKRRSTRAGIGGVQERGLWGSLLINTFIFRT
jgi:hypothetical protein